LPATIQIENIYLENNKKSKIMANSHIQEIHNIFKKNKKFVDNEGNLYIQQILESIEKIDIELVRLLASSEKTKKEFFTQVDDIFVLNQNRLIEFFTLNDYMKNGSYTSYTNKIGLIKKDNFIKKFDDVVLAFPHKDCVLEGGQTKDNDKTKEVFYNEILSSDEIDRLFEPKVLTNIKKYSKDGIEENPTIKDEDNLIIKGNNLIALHSLKKKYAGQVKLIYIDPPYNTGNDSFKYNDNFNHSTWLTFMKNRLEVARGLLRDDGVIFVQCDDNEQAYLKVLMDEVFGRENFVGTLIHQRAKGGGNAKHIVKGHDYITIYVKNLSDKNKFIREKVIQAKVVEIDGKSYIRNDDVVRKVFGKYDTSAGDRRCFYEELGKYKNEKQILEINNKIKSGEYVLEDFGNGLKVIVKYTPIEESYSKLYSIVKALSEDGTNEINELGLDFSNPKPEQIIKFLIESVTKPNDIVLDYHLGSGTTCAVAHKMGRRYIGIEQMDYIEDIAVERLKKVIDGEQGGISKAVNWNGGGDFVYAELKTIDTFKDAEIGALNKNMQYLPISEIEDDSYNISKEECEINKAFYGIENE